MRAQVDCLRAVGHDVRVWVGRRNNEHTPACYQSIPADGRDDQRRARFMQKGLFGLGLEHSLDFCVSDALNDVDIIHLHNLHGHYLDLQSLSLLATRAPLVWTLHDYYAITGGCAFPGTCDRWMQNCGDCPAIGQYPMMTDRDRTRLMLRLKRQFFADVPVAVTCPSRHLADAAHRSGLFRAGEILHIPYGVDTDVFRPQREESRKTLGLRQDDRVLFLAAQGLEDPRKGTIHALHAVAEISDISLTLLLAGHDGGEVAAAFEAMPHVRTHHVGYVSSPPEMAHLYAAADVFLFSSLAENFPCSVMESMACGTPVAAFAIDGVNEQITEGETGFLATPSDSASLAQAVRRALNATDLPSMRQKIRDHTIREWSMSIYRERHEALYRERLQSAESPKRAMAAGGERPVLRTRA